MLPEMRTLCGTSVRIATHSLPLILIPLAFTAAFPICKEIMPTSKGTMEEIR